MGMVKSHFNREGGDPVFATVANSRSVRKLACSIPGKNSKTELLVSELDAVGKSRWPKLFRT